MPLVRDYEQTQELYSLCAASNLTMARIGYSDQDQIQAIVRGAARFAADHSISRLPIGIFVTVGHYIMQQLPRYLTADHALPSNGGDTREYHRRLFLNARLATDFMEVFTDPADSDFGSVCITHHYDHGHHTLPGGVLSENELLRQPEFIDLFSSVMFDDTHSPFEDNCRNSADYRAFLEAEGRKKVLEGCLEEVAAGGDFDFRYLADGQGVRGEHRVAKRRKAAVLGCFHRLLNRGGPVLRRAPADRDRSEPQDAGAQCCLGHVRRSWFVCRSVRRQQIDATGQDRPPPACLENPLMGRGCCRHPGAGVDALEDAEDRKVAIGRDGGLARVGA